MSANVIDAFVLKCPKRPKMAFKMSQEFLTVSLDVMLTSVTLLTLIIFNNIRVQTVCVYTYLHVIVTVQLHHFKGDQMSDISWHHILCSRARLIMSDLQSYIT